MPLAARLTSMILSRRKKRDGLGVFDMSDFIFPVATLIFFVVSVAYLYGCKTLKGGDDNA